jgi:hypothetical protein
MLASLALRAMIFLLLVSTAWQWFVRNKYVMEHYLVELDGDQVELLSGMVREAIKVADEKEVPALEALLSALGIMSWKAGDRKADWGHGNCYCDVSLSVEVLMSLFPGRRTLVDGAEFVGDFLRVKESATHDSGSLRGERSGVLLHLRGMLFTLRSQT